MHAPEEAALCKLTVPMVFHKSIDTVHAAVKQEKPDAVLCVGQAGGRFEITPERVAINVDDARIPDNEGNQPIDQPVFADGPSAYFTMLRLRRWSKRSAWAAFLPRFPTRREPLSAII